METKDIIIKAKRLPSLLFAILSLAFLFASIYCVILPATDTLSGPLALYIKIVYLIIGCIGTVFFGYKATFHIIKFLSPPTSIVITEEGLLDYTIPDGGLAFVSWENVAETKLFGDKKCDWLGISLRTTQKVFMGLTRAARTEISANIDAGMPAIIIKASDISIDIYELRSLINERLSELKSGLRTRVMPNKPSVSQVYGSASEKETYKDDKFIIEPRLKNDDEYEQNAAPIVDEKEEAPVEAEINDTVVEEAIDDDVKIAEPTTTEAVTESEIRNSKREVPTTFILGATSQNEQKKDSKITIEFVDAPEIEEDEAETTMNSTVKNGERFFEISRRPKKKSEVAKEEENIDDILSALSAGRKKDGE